MNKKKITDERLFLLCILTALIAFFTQLSEIPQAGRIYPMVLLIASTVLCIYIIVFKAGKGSSEIFTKRQVLDCVILGVMVLIYILLQNAVGYIIASLLFLYAALFFLGLKNNKLLFFLYPICITLIIYFLFNKVLHVLLPEGFLISVAL
ncbi:tripartite tricarboxylate transporter TctB family protein [Treponema sp. OMZ 840]|uniref:tripartite tricarboxylate transporter TctB family protein n=1 Tax=Treponema sp. OMZ 840 TaxID=244313 RepID=UPI003D9008E8